ncbi:heparinase II/III domain-containing protein [Paenibacillus oceani]|uniref:Heparinase II/III family protein n=1 Tax=Paenibacillus oceani TaxID=2772510 RepID=A0A927GYB9_9BACL|nr:heparinase II/III family protein [Paenibacillus oceani]MBD2861440.1 heparinase II/III family protein [Paenibacillus oceani]
MSVSIRRPISVVLCLLMLVSAVSFTASQPALAAGSGVAEFIMPDTTVYRFGSAVPGQPTVTLAGDPNAAPKVTNATYGVKIESTLTAPSRTFEFQIAQAGNYIVKLGGMTGQDGGTADVSIDGVKASQYGFYSVTGKYPRPDLYVQELPLTAGTHTITLTVTGKGNGVGNGTGTVMYPHRLVLINSDQVTNSKTRRTYMTDAKMAAARQNVQQYDWAAALRDSVLAKADAFVALGYEGLWNLVPTQAIPRSYNTNQLTGNFSPVSGDLKSYGNYPWKADPLNDPWKITDPASGYKFPTNDFGAYYRSGLDEHGNFNPALADRTLLVNTLYPDKGPTWGVDDGYGWVDPQTNKRYTFIAYYAHWFAWYGSPANVNGALSHLQSAYVYTGDEKYAKAGAVLLDRVADVYPSLDVAEFSNAVYVNSHGGTGDGKAVGSIWETSLVKVFIGAYDAFFTAFDAPDVVAFLQAKGQQYKLPLKSSGTEIRRNIEDGILRQVQPGMYWDQIRGNNGFHQSAVALAAVVHDTLPETKDWLDFVFQPGAFVNQIPRRVTGGNVLFSMVNDVDRDGHGNEAGPGYNKLWLNTYLTVADALDGYDKYPAADLYENVKFRKMFQAMYPLTMLGRYTPSIGDSGTTGQPGIQVDKAQSIKAFERFGDPVYAQLAYMLNGNKTEGIHSDVYTANPNQVAADIEAVIAQHGPLDLDSTNLTGYGLAALRDGAAGTGADTRRAMWTYYGRTSGHGHRDMLNLGLYGFGIDLLPDLGYPEQANATDVNRFEWVNNTISHNTVMVDKKKQAAVWDGTPTLYDDSSMVKLFEAEAPKAYPQTELYKRTSAMVKVDEANSYVVDFFRVKGGSEHHFSFHAAEGPVTTEGLSLTAQPTGTYAGPGVEFGVRPANDSVTGSGYAGPGFHWLKNVERDNEPSAAFSVDYDVEDTWNVHPVDRDIHVRMTMLGELDDVALADGVPPRNKPGNPESLKYVVAHRSGLNLDSTFTSVIEPYENSRFISDISQASVSAAPGSVSADVYGVRAVKVQLANGRTDYVISSMNPDAAYVIDGKIRFQGSFGVYSENGGQPVFSYVNNGASIGRTGPEYAGYANTGVARLEGTVTDFTRELSLQNKLQVQLDLQDQQPGSLIGRSVYVRNDGQRNAVYLIKDVVPLGGGLYELDLGDITLIRSYASTTDLSQGFKYDVAPGNTFVIPLARQLMWPASITIVSPKTELTKNETVQLQVKGWYADGTEADLSGYELDWDSERPNIANVNGQSRLKAHNKGTTTISVEVEPADDDDDDDDNDESEGFEFKLGADLQITVK